MELACRITSGLLSLACGDALGVLAVGYTNETLVKAYGEVPVSLRESIPSSQARTKWGFAEVTDDTYQTMAVAESIVSNHTIQRSDLVRRLLSLPKRYIKDSSSSGRLRSNANPYINRFSITCGGVMRVSPIGMAFRDPNRLMHEMLQATQITHNSRSSIGGAAAIVYAISAMLEGVKEQSVIEYALRGAYEAWVRGYGEDDGFPPVWKEIERACSIGYDAYRLHSLNDENYGERVIEAVPFAFAVSSSFWNATTGINVAVSYGGDSDTIASIVGVLCGTHSPCTVPTHICRAIKECDQLKKISNDLCRIREEQITMK